MAVSISPWKNKGGELLPDKGGGVKHHIGFVLSLFLPDSSHVGEKWNALTAMAWGIWLLLPQDTWGAGLYRTFIGAIGTEIQWGLAATVLGGLSLAACIGEWSRLRTSTNILLTMMWFLLALVTLTQSTASSGVLYLLLWGQQMTYVYSSVASGEWKGGRWIG